VPRRDRTARVLARARLWAPLVVVAAVPVSVLAAGGSTPAGGSGAALAGVSVPSDTSTTTGIGRSICHIVGTPACKDTPTTSDTGSATDTGTDTTTAAADTSALGPPDTGLCSNAKVPGLCRTSSQSSTVTVRPPGTVTDTSTKTKSTGSAKGATTKTKSKSAATTTVTVTVTQSSTASRATTATTTP
jgi:hypothetical protein